ncbi:MAG TPA: hypothetical protein PK149_13345 [Flavobacteriales bacterium]|nr:hypothetical protein [Flavobacteriales bacterium]
MQRKTVAQFIMGIVCVCILTASSCNKNDDDGPSVNASINFLNDSGYTHRNDTLSLMDTIRVRVTIQRGDDELVTYKTERTYDGQQVAIVDSLPISGDPFEFEKQIILRDVAGVEKYGFMVVERDGDIVRRSLTFVVQ